MPCLGGEKPHVFQVRILLLDSTELHYDIRSNNKGQVLLQKAFDQLHLAEVDYFGLRYLDADNQTHWLDGSRSIGPQVKNVGNLTFYFGVKFYAADPCKLREEGTRYQFFLQVKRDILQGRLPVSFETGAELAALAVQSELGDFDSKRHVQGYVSEFRFIPNQTEEFESRTAYVHKKLVGRVPSAAEYMYLDKVKWLSMYGVDLHPVIGEANVEYFVGLTPTGVVVYRNKTKVGNYFWPRITKVNFKANVFMVKVKDKNNEENTYAFDCANKAACKHLWKCCVEHHAFFRLTQAQASAMQADRTFTMSSKYRYSGRTERQVAESQKGDNSQVNQVMRVPSKRHERRLSAENRQTGEHQHESTQNDGTSGSVISGHGSTAAGSVKAHRHSRHREHNNNVHDSPRSARSVPAWESGHRKGGLYTTGRDSPTSVRSDKMMFPSRRTSQYSGSETESIPTRRHRHHHRRESDNESEASGRHHRRRRRGMDSGSESEAAYHHHHHSHRHRHSRKSAESLPHLEAEWRDIQHRVRDRGGTRGGTRGETCSNPGDIRPQNGSMQSMPGSEGQYRHRQKRRGRSRSPGYRAPHELEQHFKYIEPEPGMTQEQLMDIPYTKVETIVDPLRGRHSPHATRHRYRSPRRKNNGDVGETKSEHAPSLPPSKEEPPPPYSSGGRKAHPKNHRSQPDLSSVRPAPSVQHNETHAAPIVKTKHSSENFYENSSSVSQHSGVNQNNEVYTSQAMPVINDPITSGVHIAKGSPQQTKSDDISDKHPRDDSGLGIEQTEASSTSSQPAVTTPEQNYYNHANNHGQTHNHPQGQTNDRIAFTEQESSERLTGTPLHSRTSSDGPRASTSRPISTRSPTSGPQHMRTSSSTGPPSTQSAGTNTSRYPANMPYSTHSRASQNPYSASPHGYTPPGPAPSRGVQEHSYEHRLPAPHHGGDSYSQRAPPDSDQYNRMARTSSGNTVAGKMTEL